MRSLFVCVAALALLAGCQRGSSTLSLGAPGVADALHQAPSGKLAAADLSAADLSALPAQAEKARGALVGTIPPIVGTVDYPPVREVQASIGDAINNATVNIFDQYLGRVVAVTTTNSIGGFSLSVGSWVPEFDVPYILEASKGLGNYVPGWASPRFRILVRLNSSTRQWEATSTPNIVISAQTTAVAIEAGLYPELVKPELTFASVDTSVRPAGFLQKPVFFAGPANATPNPDYSGHPVAELIKLSAEIMTYLANDMDPVISVPEVTASVTGLTPDHGKAKDIVRIAGRGFSPLLAGNKVTFNGVAANVMLAKPTELTVEVPAGATTGNLVVEGRNKTAPKTFTIDASGPAFGIDFVFPTSGTPGSTITILGFGFSKTPADNTVYFDNVSTTCVTSDTNFCTAVVPAGAQKGPISVDVKNVGLSTTLPYSVLITVQVDRMFPNKGTPNQEVTLTGSNFGTTAGTVKISGVSAPIVSWKDTEIIATVPFNSISGNLTVTKGTLPPLTVGTFGILSGNITGWTTINNSGAVHTHNGAWHGRWKKWWYLGGGYASGGAIESGYNKGPVERAEIMPDGSLGPLEVLPGVQTGAGFWNMEAGYDMAHSPNVIGDYAYAYPNYETWGDYCQNRTVLRAQFFENGEMSNFAPVYQTAIAPGHWSGTLRMKDFVYLLTGTGCGNDGKIQSAKINSDGTLQPFTVLSATYPFGYNNGFAQVGRYLYGFGGPNRNELYRIEVNADGSLKGAFNSVSPALPVTLAHGNVAVIGGWLYLISGHSWNGGGWTNRLWRASINPADDSLGSWEEVGGMPSGQHDAGVLLVGEKLYITGQCCHGPNINVATIQ